jgi:hypothetical protein
LRAVPRSTQGGGNGGRLKVAARTCKHQLNAAHKGVTLHRFEFRSFVSNTVATNHSFIRTLGFLNRMSRVRVPLPSLFSFFELAVTPGFTQRGVLVSIQGGVVSAILARCCDDEHSGRDLSDVPLNAPISIFQTSPASFGLRTLSVSPKTAPRFKTPFGTANRYQP